MSKVLTFVLCLAFQVSQTIAMDCENTTEELQNSVSQANMLPPAMYKVLDSCLSEIDFEKEPSLTISKVCSFSSEQSYSDKMTGVALLVELVLVNNIWAVKKLDALVSSGSSYERDIANMVFQNKNYLRTLAGSSNPLQQKKAAFSLLSMILNDDAESKSMFSDLITSENMNQQNTALMFVCRYILEENRDNDWLKNQVNMLVNVDNLLDRVKDLFDIILDSRFKSMQTNMIISYIGSSVFHNTK